MHHQKQQQHQRRRHLDDDDDDDDDAATQLGSVWPLVCSCKWEQEPMKPRREKITRVGSEYDTMWADSNLFLLKDSTAASPVSLWECRSDAHGGLAWASSHIAAAPPPNLATQRAGRCKTQVGGRQGLFCNLSSGLERRKELGGRRERSKSGAGAFAAFSATSRSR